MKLVAGCVVLATMSLLLASQPSFDPWAWIVWGRELSRLELDTLGGPSWKPLPVLFTTAFAPFESFGDDVPPALWLVVARTGVLLSVVLAFRVTRRLAGPGRWSAAAAGAIAALLLACAPQWLRYAAHGNEVPLAVAFMLAAADRHLDGRRSQALALGVLACLLRPEVFPFVAVYAIWLLQSDRSRWPLVAGLATALAALWLVPEWVSTGRPFDAGAQAASEPPWSLSHSERPWLEVLLRAHRIAGLPLELGVIAAAGFAIARRDARILALVGVVVGWLALVAVMTQIGFTGSPRYFVPALVLAYLLTGLAVAWTVANAARVGRAAAVGTAIALALAATPYLSERADLLRAQAHRSGELARLHDELVLALEAVGGPERIAATGPPSTNRGFATHLAWETGLPLRKVLWARGWALVFVAPPSVVVTGPPRGVGSPGPRGLAGEVAGWKVLAPTARRFAGTAGDVPNGQ